MASKEPSTDKSIWGKNSGWKYSVATRYILFLLLALLFYISLASKLLPERYDIQVNTKSEKNIVSPVQIEDSKATLKAQEAAAESVQPIYPLVPLRNDVLVTQILDRIERLNQDVDISSSEKVGIYRNEIPRMAKEFVQNFVSANSTNEAYSKELLDEMQRVIEEQTYRIPEETFIKLPRLNSEDIIEMKSVAREIVSRLMLNEIFDAQTARARVAEMVSTSRLDDRTSREVVQELSRLAITPNKFLDEVATKEARVEKRENTPPVFIKQGDILVAKGQLITPELYELLGKNGLLKDEVNYWPELGVLLLSALLSLGILMFIRQSDPGKFKYNNSQLLMLLLVYVITLITMHLTAFLQSDSQIYVGYLAPVAIGAILVTLLLETSLAYFSVIIFSIMASVILNVRGELFDFQFGLFAAVTSCVAIFSIHRASQRSTMLKGGIMASLFGALIVFIMLLINNDTWTTTETLYSIGFAIAGGLLTAILVIGLMPFFEVTFGILSALKLVELSNPNHPLLRKLLTETPGTYHHSVMVGNLSEAAAEAIGANGLLCRVGSYYHDIGKTKRPIYFIENQNNMENPHDSIEPKLSKSIIVAHARDGVEMLKEYKLPKPIRDIAEQHHGTTFLHYFYHKAVRQAEEQGIEPDFTEDDFRYHGPKAQSKESAIVGIADSVEAAVRSLRKPTVEQVESMIEKIIKGRLDDHQFNDCDLTMKELDIIAKTLKETVMGIFHSRIEYPEDVKRPKPPAPSTDETASGTTATS
ncbi:HDIG domain-containing protein [Paenibacillus glucanolyticus]|jgi:putative nucleotidyltransferase with HDIG domain|uniref:Metal-dependent phosphohydrolase n=1 Tax=Paenibacillus glucanolyticus TaxID=59843 RepID=A0A163KZK4_9BACL|nr:MULTISPECIES: HDIG domain-containing metalloprotein [Paenibacillus]ANA81631.1 metal-dependent phosphohydrolase [Paenibacillus glucanolyticus]AVV59638.1 HDIG domain-containing protein [Paenibacillus glucanolyticus]AWP28894.1 metal-dependent phosphohydrolase [Paenibacillus sp. Cedars]ETT30333.1 7TM receptor with intracellular metal dependent phosphohydrolase [Paenibacillus sp. FSL R5-808]KZS47674.1 metal-dependent phosphohydrolase [Paenibacillus glucanolyticus]